MPRKKTPAPIASATDTSPPTAMFDIDPATAPAAVEPVEPVMSSEASIAPSDAPASADDPADEQTAPAVDAVAAPSDAPVKVRLGQVEGLLHRIPISDVQAQFPNFVDRIAALQGSPSIANLQQRMLATEGRCAPIIVTINREAKVLAPLAGIESVAAALNIGLSHVFVIMIDAGDADTAQRHCVANAQGQPLSSKNDCYQPLAA